MEYPLSPAFVSYRKQFQLNLSMDSIAVKSNRIIATVLQNNSLSVRTGGKNLSLTMGTGKNS